MNSQYKTTHGVAGARPRHWDGSELKALLRCAGIALAATAIAALALAPAVAQAQQQTPAAAPQRNPFVHTARMATVMIAVGKSQDVRTDRGFSDVMVSDPDVAVVSPLTDHSLSILAKKIGSTRVTVYDQDKQPVEIFDVEVSYDLSGLQNVLSRFSGGGIRVSAVSNHIMLSGVAPDAATLDKAVQIARQFDKDLVNTVQLQQQQQVMLEVRFIEASRQASRQLGVQWNYFGNSAVANVGNALPAQQLPITQAGGAFQQPGATIGGPSTIASNINGSPLSPVVAAGVLSGSAPFGFLVGQLTNRLQVEVNALEEKGLARSLAEPNLVALSGDTASFLAGGQIPIPEVGSLGAVSFGYQPYGVGLSFTPTVLGSGLINLVINPEVSEIDPSTSVTVAGTSVPGLIVRKASTTLELRDGQSFMLGGLLQNTNNTAQNQLPWAGDLPVIGALFRSSEYQKNETDLIIVVTPHIVHPMAPTATIHTPLDNSLPANDIDFFLMGNAEVSPSLARLALGALNRPYVGHILDLPKQGGVYVSARD